MEMRVGMEALIAGGSWRKLGTAVPGETQAGRFVNGCLERCGNVSSKTIYRTHPTAHALETDSLLLRHTVIVVNRSNA
jgi:hypothetical protein